MKNTLTINVPTADRVGFYSQSFKASLSAGASAGDADQRARLSVDLMVNYVTEQAVADHKEGVRRLLHELVSRMLANHRKFDTTEEGAASLRWFNMGTHTRLMFSFAQFLRDEEVEAVLGYIGDQFGLHANDLTKSLDPLGNEDKCYVYFDVSEVFGDQPFEGDFELLLAA